ncbi:efflux RND transporter periplasmic adaptor subunit [Paenibacillaceae bacterium]|nr:efflux RND transporter periplasmic adaptor subunit [Paenibacillaceae bacterium]
MRRGNVVKMKRQASPIRKVWKSIGILMAAALFAAGCSNSNEAAVEPSVTPSGPKQVKVEAVEKHSMGTPREQIGEVSAGFKMEMISKASGEVVERVKQNGDTVKQGEVIARISSERADIQLEGAVTQLQLAREALDANNKTVQIQRNKLESDIKEAERLFKEATRSQDENVTNQARETVRLLKQQLAAMDAANNSVQLEASVAAAETNLKDLRLSLGDYVIKAPSNGVLTNLAIREGSLLQAGSMIGVLQRVDHVVITVKLSEPGADLVRGKKELFFYSADGSFGKTKARVNSLDLFANPDTRMFAMELEADNPEGLIKPGTRVHVQLTTEEEENVIAIPSLSVVREGDESFAFVLNGKTAEKRTIQLGRMNGPYQEVLSGLALGDQLVVGGQHQLEANEQVEIIAK